jgi:hypothetical protein
MASSPLPGERSPAPILSAAERRAAHERRQRRMFAIVATSALLAGVVGALAFMQLRRPPQDPGSPVRLGTRPPIEAITPSPATATQTAVPPPVVDPPVTVTPAQGDPGDGKKPPHPPHLPTVGPGISTAPKIPKPPDSAQPANTGVAPGLHLKTN